MRFLAFQLRLLRLGSTPFPLGRSLLDRVVDWRRFVFRRDGWLEFIVPIVEIVRAWFGIIIVNKMQSVSRVFMIRFDIHWARIIYAIEEVAVGFERLVGDGVKEIVERTPLVDGPLNVTVVVLQEFGKSNGLIGLLLEMEGKVEHCISNILHMVGW